jgi:putative photosynthetic complex assembly protein
MIDISDPLGLERPSKPIPRSILAAGSGLLLVALVLTFLSARTGVGRVEVATVASDAPVAQLSISFVTTQSGEIRIEGDDGTVLTSLAPGEGGFLRGIVRPLRRERERYHAPLDEPFVLTRHASGALVLSDPTTDLHVDIAAFGATSMEHFLQLFAAGDMPR